MLKPFFFPPHEKQSEDFMDVRLNTEFLIKQVTPIWDFFTPHLLQLFESALSCQLSWESAQQGCCQWRITASLIWVMASNGAGLKNRGDAEDLVKELHLLLLPWNATTTLSRYSAPPWGPHYTGHRGWTYAMCKRGRKTEGKSIRLLDFGPNRIFREILR